jgi:hypothetical protein
LKPEDKSKKKNKQTTKKRKMKDKNLRQNSVRTSPKTRISITDATRR